MLAVTLTPRSLERATSVPIPKFANQRGLPDANFGIKKGHQQLYGASVALDLKFLSMLAAPTGGTSNPPR
jgi:hypothetical protein